MPTKSKTKISNSINNGGEPSPKIANNPAAADVGSTRAKLASLLRVRKLSETAVGSRHGDLCQETMRRHSPGYYSPPRRGFGGGRERSPPRRGYGGGGGGGRGGIRNDESNGSLLVRNIPLDCRPEELCVNINSAQRVLTLGSSLRCSVKSAHIKSRQPESQIIYLRQVLLDSVLDDGGVFGRTMVLAV